MSAARGRAGGYPSRNGDSSPQYRRIAHWIATSTLVASLAPRRSVRYRFEMGGKAPDDDVVWYPSEDHMGEHELQTRLAMTLWLSVRRHLAAQRRDLRSGHDPFFDWKKGDPTSRLAPDVYVLDVRGPDEFVGVWKTWEGPYAPAFAVEIVGDDFRKDYDDAPVGYATMRTRELVIFDAWATQRSRVRVRWQIYRAGADGRLVAAGIDPDA